MSTIHLIDFENVRSAGLAGLGPLGEGDQAIVFFSDACRQLDLGAAARFLGSGASLRTEHVATGSKNALDFQLASKLGCLIGERAPTRRCFTGGRGLSRRFRIVSNDTGFDCVVGYWRERGVDVERVGTEPASEGPGAPDTKACSSGGKEMELTGLKEQDKPAEVERILATVRGKKSVLIALDRLYHDTQRSGRVYRVIEPRIKD